MARFILLPALVVAAAAHAQVPHGGSPFAWGGGHSMQPEPPTWELPALNMDSVLAVSENADSRLGVQRQFNVDMLLAGAWEDRAGGGRVCRYTIRSAEARMLSVQFSAFHPASGARLFVYDAGRTRFLGGFTTENERPDGLFATAFLPGEAVTLEYQEPANAARGEVRIAGITHAWRGELAGSQGAARDFNPGYQSSPCHTNVACPAAAAWQPQVRATVMFARPDGNTCNGTLLNNTLQDGKPYVLIANHCYQPNSAQWVFYFNYQSPTCVGDTGQTMQTITGAVQRAALYAGDFCLMELSQPPPPSFNAYYAGWDRSGAVPQSGACISDPLSDVKKFNRYSAPATTATEDETLTPCWSVFWAQGIMEPAASGAPLFDQNKRVVGHLVQGTQTCATATTMSSQAVKFSAIWNMGTTPATRLRDWLDPANNTTALDGFDPNAATPHLAVRAKCLLQGPADAATGLMTSALNDAGLIPLTEPYTALGYVHQGGGGGETVAPAVLAATGTVRIVDWVVLELRNKNNVAQVLATRSALLRRDGRITDTDGTADVQFTGWPADQYYLAVRHRNHLGIMTDLPVSLAATAQLIDLSGGTPALRGGADATAAIGALRALWCGDVNGNGTVRYTGMQNDRDPILVRIGGLDPIAVYAGYAMEDVNMDGTVKYTGTANDRDPILQNVGGNAVGVRAGHLP